MPNQSNPDQGQQNGLGTTPIVQQSDLPPLPVDFTGATPAALQPEVTVPAPSSTSGEKSGTSAPPPPAFSDITTPPKKKFGTGKIIATILGIFVLVGGVAAAVLTINQKQLFQQKAEETIQSRWPANGTVCYSTGGNQERVGGCIVFYCPNGCSGVCNEGSPGVYTEYYMDPQNCNNASNALGNYCGQIDVVDTNGRYCQVPGYGDLIQCTASCTRPPPRTPTPTPTPRVTLSPSPSPTPTPSPSPTSSPTPLAPYCVAVSTYRDTSSEGGWMLIPPADRPMLKTSDEIYFCVSGYRGVFDKARFTITRNGVAGSPIETTSLRPNSTDFCIPYTILSGTVDINVKGELHDSVGNRWTGGISVD